MPVYVTTASHLRFAIASQAVTVAEGFGIAAIIGGLRRSALWICPMAALFRYVRYISKASEMELGADCAIEADSIESLTSRICGGTDAIRAPPCCGVGRDTSGMQMFSHIVEDTPIR
jgi:hypothetical protein